MLYKSIYCILFSMSNIKYSFLITSIAGISTIIGILPIFFNTKNKDKIINFSLSFSSGVMISVSLFSLLPESINLLSTKYSLLNIVFIIIIFSMVGISISIFIDKIFKFIPDKLYSLGIINMITLMLHNIPEGILTFATTSSNKKLGTIMALSIMCHNIPEGISIAIPIYYSTKSKLKAFFYTFISGFSEILGAIITYLFLYKYINTYFIGYLLATIIGLMIYIPIYELLPTALNYKNKKITAITFLIGIIFMYIFK